MLHQISSKTNKRKSPRIGRGGKRGTYSGKGIKGQKSRAGTSMRPGEQDFIIRIPKLRGFKNKSIRPKPRVVNVSDLERVFSSGDVVTPQELIKRGLVTVAKSDRDPHLIKVLGMGELKKSLNVEGLSASKTAISKILSAGGAVR